MFEYAKCPNCGNRLFIPKSIRDEKIIKCTNCNKNFDNPTIKNKRYLGVAAIAFIIFAIYSNMNSKNDSKSISEYSNNLSTASSYINTTTYGATSKKALDDLYVYLSNNDNAALNNAINNGEIIEIPAGTEINIVKNHFSYTIVKLAGDSQDIYVVTDHITVK